MAANLVHSNSSVRVLKKVRRQFLHRTPEEEEPDDTNHALHCLLNNKTDNSTESNSHAEQNKKLCFAPEHINLYFHVVSAVIENWLGSKVVTLNLSRNEGASALHWEHATSKLESFGDLESTLWAQRIRNRITEYRKSMSKYYDLIKSEDPLVPVSLSKIKRKAILKCREVERQFSFQKHVQYLKKDTHEPLSISYSEDFLKRVGHNTPEDFVDWSNQHGIPKTFEIKNQVFQNIMKEFISYVPTIECPIKEGEEYETIVTDREGNPKTILARFIGIFEPSPEASFNYIYFAVKKNEIIEKITPQKTEDTTELKLKRKLEDTEEISTEPEVG